MNIIRSAYSVFPNETYGFLYGHTEITNSQVYHIIESALPLQEIKRTPKNVHGNSKEEKRLLWGPKNLEELIGDFHSHPDHMYSISETDIKDTSEDSPIYLIISIRKIERHRPFTHTEFGICGNLNNSNMRIGLRGYYYTKKGVKVAKLRVRKDVLRDIFRM